ncbi:MAG: hypothetical protein LH628_10430 [Microcoleus sp. CAN_BIN18]|nr:hypothetical protein [Microcoleus sp. CAN_BIN18]
MIISIGLITVATFFHAWYYIKSVSIGMINFSPLSLLLLWLNNSDVTGFELNSFSSVAYLCTFVHEKTSEIYQGFFPEDERPITRDRMNRVWRLLPINPARLEQVRRQMLKAATPGFSAISHPVASE